MATFPYQDDQRLPAVTEYCPLFPLFLAPLFLWMMMVQLKLRGRLSLERWKRAVSLLRKVSIDSRCLNIVKVSCAIPPACA